ncbi:MAG: aminomethyl-transferring glycine dehydrogenase [Bacteroidales bacterium]|nr:aminomethyl-transferring glycine dehydrogenase [Bacteroidales bacterium]
MISNNFINRHNGPASGDIDTMLGKIGVTSVEELIRQTIPASIRLQKPMQLPRGMNEYELLRHLRGVASKNKIYRSYIGLGYYNTITPGVITRNILENPGWYTSYTPYQAEISQGRLEALLNYQTVISDMTGLPVANASLLDEGTAASEAMIMLFNARSREMAKRGADRFLVSSGLFPQTVDILRTRANPLGIRLEIKDAADFDLEPDVFGMILQYPDITGEIHDYHEMVARAGKLEIRTVVAADLMSLAMLVPPGEWGADVVVGSSQRFGLPMGFGGPHAGFFATTAEYKRLIPGRIIGLSVDSQSNKAYRMALQTREQHIKRERATSNICTAQALLAIMAGMYAVYHGSSGIQAIAEDIHMSASILARESDRLGYKRLNATFFDTIRLRIPQGCDIRKLESAALSHRINFLYVDNRTIGISVDETTGSVDIAEILTVLAEATGQSTAQINPEPGNLSLQGIPASFRRTSSFLTHPIFNSLHSETALMRYIKTLENKDLALNRTMIPLGSCTMKLNAAAELFPLSWPEFAEIHPFVPSDQAKGYLELIRELEADLCEITGFKAISFQPNSGAAGEYTGLMVIREYLKEKGQGHRNICLIPSSAHGTNPASSVMAGLKVVVVACDNMGNIDTDDLRAKASEHRDNLAALMVTYPSTHGVFEEEIEEITRIIHGNGGQVYMDGANMNAQAGLTNPALIGADVCHLNLHKTFAIPHGGGGPGVGPIGVADHLAPFLPRHPLVDTGGIKGITAVAAAPYGSAMILPISYAYIKLLGGEGLTEASRMAILNANYLKSCLEDHYPILYKGKNGRVAHEMILDCNQLGKSAGITVSDIAKRLMDYGFHAPTVAFPVHGTLMVEPTESEPLEEMDRFVDAMIRIREEIRKIENGEIPKEINLLKSAPHTIRMITGSNWEKPYSREEAAFPGQGDRNTKYWPPVGRIDDAFGDRNLICTCDPISNY